jgi:hypothetical protein
VAIEAKCSNHFPECFRKPMVSFDNLLSPLERWPVTAIEDKKDGGARAKKSGKPKEQRAQFRVFTRLRMSISEWMLALVKPQAAERTCGELSCALYTAGQSIPCIYSDDISVLAQTVLTPHKSLNGQLHEGPGLSGRLQHLTLTSLACSSQLEIIRLLTFHSFGTPMLSAESAPIRFQLCDENGNRVGTDQTQRGICLMRVSEARGWQSTLLSCSLAHGGPYKVTFLLAVRGHEMLPCVFVMPTTQTPLCGERKRPVQSVQAGGMLSGGQRTCPVVMNGKPTVNLRVMGERGSRVWRRRREGTKAGV